MSTCGKTALTVTGGTADFINARMRLPYTFTPVIESDLPLLEAWLHAPELVAWWGDPVEQAQLLRTDIDEPRMRMEQRSVIRRILHPCPVSVRRQETRQSFSHRTLTRKHLPTESLRASFPVNRISAIFTSLAM
ncbi:MAG TPA: hypothetical protein VII35_00100 [Steroidobacteraceae bacterium]